MAMRTSLKSALLAICMTAGLLAQNASVEGTVFGANHQPLAGAVIILLPRDAVLDPAHHQTTSNSSGRFSFPSLPPGRYSVMAMHESYADYDSTISGVEASWAAAGPWKAPEPLLLSAGKNVTGFDIALVPLTILSGKVLDEDGNPVNGVQVRALTARFVENGRLIPALTGEEVKSGANGEYKIAVTPGQRCFVLASPEPPLTPAYYPDARDLSSAIATDTSNQYIAGLNIQLKKGSFFHVRGMVKGTQPAGLRVLFWRETGEAKPERYGTPKKVLQDGTFELSGLAPGIWTLDLRQEGKQNSFGRRTIQIKDVDVEDVALLYTPPVEVSGMVKGMTGTKGIPATLQVRLRSLGPGLSTAGVRVADDGAFLLKSVEAGLYRLDLMPPSGHYVQAALLGGTDVLNNGLDLTGGARVSGLEITLSAAPAQVTGAVTTTDGTAAAAAVVTLIPDGPPGKIYRPELYLSALSSPGGQFAFRNVVPGRYRVQAWERLPLLPSPLNERLVFPDPEFPLRFENQSTVVTVGEGESKAVTVTMISRTAVLQETGRRP